MQTLFAELRRYLRFGAEDEALLVEVKPRVVGVFPVAIDAFYAEVLEHEDARAALERGERRVGQLKVTLRQWMEELFDGPWDVAYLERRARIGTMHVRIGLPQHFMVTAMNVVRTHLTQALPDEAHARHRLAIHRVLDLDLAIMLHTYRQELEARQVRAERLATFGQLVGSIGHELRNPLGVIETSLYVLKSRNDPDPKLGKHLDRIGQQVTIANDIITQLLDLIRDRPLARQRVSLDETFSGLATALARPEAVVVSFPPQTGAFVSGDPIQLRQVFFNLVDNATHAAAPTGKVEVQVGRSTQGMVDITVDDSGPGIDRAIAARLFEPLVTTKPKGIGLGLALVKRIVDRHQGTIEVSRGPLGGARFTVRLHEVTP